jgi:hypothetical protein
MAVTIPDLWPNDIRIDVLSPLQILRMQEGNFSEKMKGLLQVQVGTVTAETLVQHQFDIVAPYLDHYRERLFTATYNRLRFYPVTVEADCFEPKPKTPGEALSRSVIKAINWEPPPNQRVAATQEEFVTLVREILHSDEVRSLIQSLIARSNETRSALAPASGNTNEGAPPSNKL